MEQLITGIHHVTAVASDAQRNIDFYTGVLGLRLVKQTVNFDGPDVYHFYYGNGTGDPGTLLTFFPYPGLIAGRQGKGMLNTTGFSVPYLSLQYWIERLNRFNILQKRPQERFPGEVVIYFEDDDGLGLELVFNDFDKRAANTGGIISPEHSIRGLYHVEIWVEGFERTGAVLTEQLDHKLIAEKSNRFRFAATDTPGNYVDILCSPDSLKGLPGSGAVHHIAFATSGRTTQELVRSRISKRMLDPTPVLDRNYFTSVYFREPGGVLFEVATAGPGFAVDESKEQLGESLRLPDRFEKDREEIMQKLTPITIRPEKYK